MAARPILVVVVAGNAQIRCALAKCLAMQGVELLTASAWETRPFDGPTVRPQSLLVIDEPTGEAAAAIARQRREGRWRRVVTLPAGTAWIAPADILTALFANGTSASAA